MRKLSKMSFGYQNSRRTKPKFWQSKKNTGIHVVSFTPTHSLVAHTARGRKIPQFNPYDTNKTRNNFIGRIIAYLRSAFSLLRTRFFGVRSTLHSHCFSLVLTIHSADVYKFAVLWIVGAWFFVFLLNRREDDRHY